MEPEITADMAVDEVMRRWPGTVTVFIRRRMACVGCAIGPLHTVAEAGFVYGLPAAILVEELRVAARR